MLDHIYGRIYAHKSIHAYELPSSSAQPGWVGHTSNASAARHSDNAWKLDGAIAKKIEREKVLTFWVIET